jgi:hypothetical protein
MLEKSNSDTELQGLARLITEATLSVTDIVEAMHHRIVHPPFLPSTPIQRLITGIAGITYQGIRTSTRIIGKGLDKGIGRLAPLTGDLKSSPEKEIIQSVLNGVLGDYLEAKENPLAIKMDFRPVGEAANGRILLMIHGSCLNDQTWTRGGHNHGLRLATELNKTPVFLRYNSGRHISTNGRELSELLEELLVGWTQPVEELMVLAHSMGGLVLRSALYYAQQQEKMWPQYLRKIVFLGTPHHGAPLEQLGNYLDAVLATIPYTQPLARLARVRSAGVTDLRYGNLLDQDWQGRDRFKLSGDIRRIVPLPDNVTCYSLAAVMDNLKKRIPVVRPGDGLVEVSSALGQHKEAAKNLSFKEENTWVARQHSHLDLLNSTAVFNKIKEWLI